jgi:hypothetical protein
MITVVWDVDDVLNDLMQQWFSHSWMIEHPDCRIEYMRLKANPPHESLGISGEEYLSSLDAFRFTDRAMNMHPNAEVLAWFHAHGSRFRHIALTARPLATAPDVAHWVMRHFGAWIRCFGVVPSRAGADVPVYDRTKGEFLQWLRMGDVLVDDSPENIGQAKALGLKALLFAQPWNEGVHTAAELLRQLSDMEEKS